MKYLFKHWDEVRDKIRDRHLFIFLDYDGTLTPIVETPEKAVLSKATKGLLEKISESPRFRLAFISGRTLKDIKGKIGLKNAIYSGNHGLEIEGPKIRFEAPVSEAHKRILEKIKSDLKRKVAGVKGVFLEDKGLTLTLHFRLVDKKKVPFVKTAFHEAVILRLTKDEIRIKTGKKVLEVRPVSGWDKGKVVLWLLSRQTFITSHTLPVYIGDDVTDEDAFKVLKNRGITLFVGRPKHSAAQYYLKNTQDVSDFLKRIFKNPEEE
ncbi:MAG: trehalose-phosphatase [Candidatus Omnitrophota bacterium]